MTSSHDMFTIKARRLAAAMAADPWGEVSPSVYETGRVVSLAPDLPGHDTRVRFLLGAQHPGGWWGAPDGYGLVPTLSAVEALLTCLITGSARPPGAAEAAARGLRALRRQPNPLAGEPDTPARDLIVPALTDAIDRHLAAVDGAPPLPYVDGTRLAWARAALAAGHRPGKLAHVWEVMGGDAVGGPDGPGRLGHPPLHALPGPLDGASAGASPAASATRLTGHDADPVRRYLAGAAGRYDGAFPCATPVAVFVHSWTLSWLARAGADLAFPWTAGLLDSLTAQFGEAGTAAGPGLPPDADTTAVVLDTLARLGRPRPPESLWPYDLGTHFCTWPGEDGASPTVNAHVLDAFGSYLRAEPDTPHRPRYLAAMRRITAWLRERQRPDGAWDDRWHASPYYATACCALSLAESGDQASDQAGDQAREAIERAIGWVIRTQRDDGSWGRWDGTAEESAYALHVLTLATPPHDEAVSRGRRFLTMARQREDQPALWHDKDLYRPGSIVAAVTLAALRRTGQNPIPLASSAQR
ncbi:hypothetical protein J5X84_11930 [Streptosporangiaceae bacterium NEAU-GS5]|nr:hypothetical protein [Streptosporangiaceae bacterium NEAU-GS5]